MDPASSPKSHAAGLRRFAHAGAVGLSIVLPAVPGHERQHPTTEVVKRADFKEVSIAHLYSEADRSKANVGRIAIIDIATPRSLVGTDGKMVHTNHLDVIARAIIEEGGNVVMALDARPEGNEIDRLRRTVSALRHLNYSQGELKLTAVNVSLGWMKSYDDLCIFLAGTKAYQKNPIRLSAETIRDAAPMIREGMKELADKGVEEAALYLEFGKQTRRLAEQRVAVVVSSGNEGHGRVNLLTVSEELIIVAGGNGVRADDATMNTLVDRQAPYERIVRGVGSPAGEVRAVGTSLAVPVLSVDSSRYIDSGYSVVQINSIFATALTAGWDRHATDVILSEVARSAKLCPDRLILEARNSSDEEFSKMMEIYFVLEGPAARGFCEVLDGLRRNPTLNRDEFVDLSEKLSRAMRTSVVSRGAFHEILAQYCKLPVESRVRVNALLGNSQMLSAPAMKSLIQELSPR